jgi:CrcB protein
MTRAFGNFPFGTLGVNVIGSFLASVLMVLALERSLLTQDQRLILVTGVMGGFTTYSSFNYETLHLAQSGAAGLAVVNIAVTVVTCLLAGIAGIWLARALTG